MQELIKAIKQMKSGKAAGVDGIPPEFQKDFIAFFLLGSVDKQLKFSYARWPPEKRKI